MNYVKSCLIITMLLGIGYADRNPAYYNCDCNEDTWQEYYNSEGHNMVGCDLAGADLTDIYCWGSFFVGANLDNTIFDGAALRYAFFDENEEEYDDVSYDARAESGDLNLDGSNDVLDVVMLIDIIINP